MKKDLIVIIFLAVFANFIFLSWSYGGEPNVQLQAVVPLTEKNFRSSLESNLNKDSASEIQATVKENKYLQFFAKSQELDEASRQKTAADWQSNQTVYDKYASYGFMLFIMAIFASFLIIIIRFIDRLIFHWKH